MKPITFNIEEKQYKLLEAVSKATHIPMSAIIRKGIELALNQSRADVVSVEIRREIDSLLTEDKEVLDRLAKA